MAGNYGERLRCRHGLPPAEWHDLSYGTPVNRYDQPFVSFDPTKHLADRVPQVAD